MKKVSKIYSEQLVDCEICEGESRLQSAIRLNKKIECDHCEGKGQFNEIIFREVSTPVNYIGRFIWYLIRKFKNKDFYVTYRVKKYIIK